MAPSTMSTAGTEDSISLATSTPESIKKRPISEVTQDDPAAVPESDQGAANGAPAKKKTKMTEEEKRKEREAKEEEKRKEKEAKEDEKRREREAKEEEKRKEKEAKEEEKRKEKEAREKERELKKAEREEKKRVKEDEKRKKDDEKRKKEEEKAKKDRAQVRLDSFFKLPSTPMKESPNDPAATSTSPALTARAPSASPHQTKPDLQNAMPGVDARAMCDYDRVFHPFFVKQNMVVAPPHSFLRDDAAKLAVSQMIDEALSLPREGTEDSMDIDDEPEAAGTRGVTKEEIVELLHIPPHKARIHCGHVLPFSTKDILARIENPDDPGLPPLVIGSKKGPYNSTYYTKLLNKLPNKFLKFAEDIRPPYNGTYTRQPTSSGLRTGRNPLEETLPGVDYDYDSEAEWVAEDGEELLSEGEDDDDKESEASGSLDGFLDDEEDTGPKRGGTAILLPTNSGMCWEDATGKTVRPDLEDMRISFLLEGVTAPIDPFSTKYWDPQPSAVADAPSARSKTRFTAMEPPPRKLVSTNRAVPTAAANPNAAGATGKKVVPEEHMENFKRAVEGSDMTKAGLIEVLKKAFPKIGKDNIKNSLEQVAERVGDKRDDKRWVLK